MAVVDSLDALLVSELRQLDDAEQRVMKAIPKIVQACSNSDLINALNRHLDETRHHAGRIEEAFEVLETEVEAKTCAGMKGLIGDGDDYAAECDPGSVRDAAIIGAARCIEHYEIAAYETAIAHAQRLRRNPVVRLLEATLAEEERANDTLTAIAEQVVGRNASTRIDPERSLRR